MKKYGISILSFLIGCLLFSSCDDEQEVNSGSGKAATISLSFETPDVGKVVTRSLNDKTLIKDITVFIFDAKGDLAVGPFTTYYDYNEIVSTTGTIASDIEITTGIHYIYAVANAKIDANAFAKINLDGIDNKRTLLDRTASLAGNLTLTGNIVPMSGIVEGADKDGSIKITEHGHYKVQLKRIISSVNFEVSCKNEGAAFNLTSYEVVNVPLTSTLFGENKNNQSNNGKTGDNIETGTGKQTFSFSMFENLYKTNNIGSYVEREKKIDPNAVENIKFENAPEFSTYVILRGKYSGPATVDQNSQNVSADVSYYVHLGNIDEGFNNFETIRNIEYTYKISINGVDDLVAEVESSLPYDRGDGTISLVANTFNLDAHYECFNIIVPRSTSADGYSYVSDGTTAQAFDWVSFRIFDEKDEDNRTYSLVPSEVGGWKEVMKYKNGKKEYDNQLITSIDALNKSLTKYFTENGEAESVTLTCFVDENVDLNTYRECLVFKEKNSGNGSTILKEGFKFRQNYMRKFFNDNGSGYGLEVLNETGRLFNFGKSTTDKDNYDGLANMREDVGVGSDWPSRSEMQKFYAACMARNRDENGNGMIDEDELKWYLPAINQYIGMWIGADALYEARLYTFSELDRNWRYVSNTNKGEDRWILWGDQGASTGAKDDGKRGGNGEGYQLRCIRNFGQTPDAKYYKVNGNTISLNIDEVAYRNRQPSGELSREGGHMGADNRVYREFIVAEDVVGDQNLSFDDQAYLADKDNSACSNYGEELNTGCVKGLYKDSAKDKGFKNGYFKKVADRRGDYYIWGEDGNFYSYGSVIYNRNYVFVPAKEAVRDYNKWRIPNQRELALMNATGFTIQNKFLMSRTYTTFGLDRGFGYHGQNGNLFLDNEENGDNKKYYIRCVRDR